MTLCQAFGFNPSSRGKSPCSHKYTSIKKRKEPHLWKIGITFALVGSIKKKMVVCSSTDTLMTVRFISRFKRNYLDICIDDLKDRMAHSFLKFNIQEQVFVAKWHINKCRYTNLFFENEVKQYIKTVKHSTNV